MLIHRIIERKILERIKENDIPKKVIIIYGARQVGKTTMVKEILSTTNQKAEYFNCDYFDVQSLFAYENAGNFENIVKNYDLIVLDEAHRIVNIGLVLKILHDEFPHLRVIATGSSSFDLSNKINEPLTGRKIIYHLFPFSYNEFDETLSVLNSKRNFARILRFGLYPSVILKDDKHAKENLQEITSSYLFKDILEFQYLKKPEILLNLLKLLAFQISHEVSYTELAGKLQVDQTVIQRYIQLLEDNHIIFRLPALKRNLRNEVAKSRKVYFWDLGVRNAIIQRTAGLDTRDDQGQLWENFCVAERLKMLSYEYSGDYNVYFWRTYSQKEIDFIEEREGKLRAFEFKWSDKKQPKIPEDFKSSYPDVLYKTISPGNFVSEIYRF